MKNEGAGDNVLGLTMEKSQILKSQLSQKGAEFGYCANIFCNVVLFDVFSQSLDGNCAPNL